MHPTQKILFSLCFLPFLAQAQEVKEPQTCPNRNSKPSKSNSSNLTLIDVGATALAIALKKPGPLANRTHEAISSSVRGGINLISGTPTPMNPGQSATESDVTFHHPTLDEQAIIKATLIKMGYNPQYTEIFRIVDTGEKYRTFNHAYIPANILNDQNLLVEILAREIDIYQHAIGHSALAYANKALPAVPLATMILREPADTISWLIKAACFIASMYASNDAFTNFKEDTNERGLETTQNAQISVQKFDAQAEANRFLEEKRNENPVKTPSNWRPLLNPEHTSREFTLCTPNKK